VILMPDDVIDVRGLSRHFGELKAVDNIDFRVREGEVFGFLGPNGAGKTTTINMLTTVLRPTSGSAKVCGFDVVKHPREVRRCLGLVPQEYTADEDLSGFENIVLCADLYDIPRDEARTRAHELLELVHLSDARDRKVETYSGGMRRRLELACGLINRPKVLFLDEPTLGLDVQTRTAVWDYIRTLKERYGMTLFMTTHYLEEADQACDRIAIIDHGRIVAIDTPKALKDGLGGDIIELTIDGLASEALLSMLRQDESIREVTSKGSTIRIKAANGEETAPRIMDMVRSAGGRLIRISMTAPTMDEVYLDLTGRSIREEEGDKEDAVRRRMMMRRSRG